MLHLILGRAGTGKSEYITNICSQALCSDQNVILIVPEQASFNTERDILRRYGAKDSSKISVLSFTRLAQRILEQCGGIAGRNVSDSAKAAVMSAALESVSDRITVYKEKGVSPELVNTMLDTAEHLKNRHITCEMLSGAALAENNSILGQKLSEISLISEAYEAIMAETGSDTSDVIRKASDRLRTKPFFSNFIVAVDSFKSFTHDEYLMLEHIIVSAQETYITLPTDSLDSRSGKLNLFAPTVETAERLKTIADKHCISVASPVYLRENRRFNSPALYELERRLYSYDKSVSSDDSGDVRIICASTLYDEAEFTALEIKRLVREEGLRYRNIAVISRDIQRYSGIIDIMLEKHGVPFFMDRREPADIRPLFRFVLSAFEAVNEGFSSQAVINCVKTGMTLSDPMDIAELENYILTWSVTGKRWKTPFTSNPDGFEVQTEASLKRLERINKTRSDIIDPLIEFASRTDNASAKEIALAVYQLLEKVGADKQLCALYEELISSGEQRKADVEIRTWDIMMELLSSAADILGENKISSERFSGVLSLMINRVDIGSIPMGIDEVCVGSADRIRPASPCVVFILGVNDGIFPAVSSGFGAFTAKETKRLRELGIDIADSAEDNAVNEQLLAYITLTLPSDRLYLTYSTSDVTGEELLRSELISEVSSILGISATSYTSSLSAYAVESEVQAVEMLARSFHSKPELASSLIEYLRNNNIRPQAVSGIMRASARSPFLFDDPDKAKTLFGEKIKISASRVEKYSQCRFQYFCRYGLYATPARKASLDALEYGKVMHYIFEIIFSAHSARDIPSVPRTTLKAEIHDILTEYLNTVMGGCDEKPERFMYLFYRLEESAYTLISRMGEEFSQSRFEPADFELAIKEHDGDISAFRLCLPDGKEIIVEGYVDRVDIMRSGDSSYIRVIDYKTGSKTFSLSDVVYGINLQMLIYLTSIWRNGATRYGNIVPAGVLYMPSKLPSPSNERNGSYKPDSMKMNGIVLDCPEVVRGMEKDAAGIFIPVKSDKDGNIKTCDSLTTLEEFGKLSSYIDKLLSEMCKTLCSGDIRALPLGDKYDPCKYCDYRAVCGFEQGDEYRKTEKFKRDDAMKIITEGNNIG